MRSSVALKKLRPTLQRYQFVVHGIRKPFASLTSIAQESAKCGLASFRLSPDLCQRVDDPRKLEAEALGTQRRRQVQQPVDCLTCNRAIGRQVSAPQLPPVFWRHDGGHVELRQRFSVEDSPGFLDVREFKLESFILPRGFG